MAMDLAKRAAANLPLTNFAICSAISHLQNMSALDAAYAEAVVAGVVALAWGSTRVRKSKLALRVSPGGLVFAGQF